MGLIWGLQFSLAKIAYASGIHPFGFTLAISVSAACLLAAVARFRGARLPLAKRFWVYTLIAGATAIAIPNSLAVLVVGHVPAGLAAVLNTLSPLMTVLCLWWGRARACRIPTCCPGFWRAC